MASPTIDDRGWPEMRLPTSWFLLGQKEYPPKASAMPPEFGNNAPGELWPVDADKGLDHSGTVWFRRSVEWNGDGSRPVIVNVPIVIVAIIGGRFLVPTSRNPERPRLDLVGAGLSIV